MKGISGNPALAAYQRMSAVQQPKGAAETRQQPEPDREARSAAKLDISSEARELATRGPAESGATERGVSPQRVEELKAAVADGSFRVDARQVAEGLIDELG